MDTGGLGALLAREKELLDSFMALTREQHDILTRPEVDERQLTLSLARRREVLEDLERVFEELAKNPEAESSRGEVVAVLESVKKIDDQNLELCAGLIKASGEQARQMTQNRKVVAGYGKTHDVQTESFFDKRQ